MDYDQLIKNWHSKASDEDYFSKFVFEYLAFVAFLKKKLFISASNDREAIQLLKQEESIRDAYLKLVHNDVELANSWQEIMKELGKYRLGNVSGNGDEIREIEWWNCSRTNLNPQPEEERNKVKGVITDLNDWGNMIEFFYSIRNNLFHGAKDPQSDRDRVLVEHGYKALKPLVQIFLDRI